jgi:hypothetical protein
MAVLSDLNEMLLNLAADRGISQFSPSTSPNKDEVINWINDGLVLTVLMLCGARIDTGQYTPGRFDKLAKLTDQEIESDGADPDGKLALPSDTVPVSFYLGIKIGASGSEVRAVEVTMTELFERGGSGTFDVTAANPIYAWGDAQLYYRPMTANWRAIFHYIRMPAELSAGGNEIFPIDRDLMEIVTEYVKGQMWGQKQRNVRLCAEHFAKFFKLIDETLGKAAQRTVMHAI